MSEQTKGFSELEEWIDENSYDRPDNAREDPSYYEKDPTQIIDSCDVEEKLIEQQEEINALKAQVNSFLELQVRHYGNGMTTHLAMVALCDKVRSGNQQGGSNDK